MASRARAALAPLVLLVAVLAMAGCVSVPSAGPVLSYPVGQQTSGQIGQNVQVIVAGPTSNWSPNQIVTGFLTAAAAIGDQQVARAYLTPQESKRWKPSGNALVYKSGPFVQNPQYQDQTTKSQHGGKDTAGGGGGTSTGGASAGSTPSGKSGAKVPQRALVAVNGRISAQLFGHGTYAVPSSSAPVDAPYFELVKLNGQWRISSVPSELLLTQGQFADDYELRNLYFFDPDDRYLVPDPIYVPLQATTTSLVNRLVRDLITPPKDWLAEATQTSFPAADIKHVNAQVTGQLATVALTGNFGSAQSQKTLWPQVSAQLLWTLVGSGQGGSQVQSVELLVNGQPKFPGNSQGNPVQHLSEASYKPAYGASSTVYYLDSAGYLSSRNLVTGKELKLAKIGTKYSQIAVSPDGKYLAALRSGSLYVGSVDGPLAKRQGSGYTTMSWDRTDNLWTTSGGQILAFRAGVSPGSAQGKAITAEVLPPYGGLITAARIAPDGVRVALIINGNELTFGAIVWQQGSGHGLGGAIKIDPSPFSVSDLTDAGFTAVTWYGPFDVITLSGSGTTLTEYPVNGGTSTSQLLDQPVNSISASSGQAIVAGVAKGGAIQQAPTLTGAWTPVPAKGISPTYPG